MPRTLHPHTATLPSRKLSTSSGSSVSLEFPPLSLHDGPRHTPSPVRAAERIQLPRHQQPATRDPQPVYALPPISALEDLRGVDTQDSGRRLAALAIRRRCVLRTWPDGRTAAATPTLAFGAPTTNTADGSPSFDWDTFPRLEWSTRSFAYPYRQTSPAMAIPLAIRPPISPATPRSAVLGKDQLSLSRTAAPYSFPRPSFHNDWLTDGARPDSRISACRYSCMEDASDSTPLPLTSW
ncbi:hypothetical protein B0H14DRAFT_3645236 [Mycena olivaceomarginata]|nr:hypothetical protein B0H14DRAFT_3645236 [Mycena olivaceomarginata]